MADEMASWLKELLSPERVRKQAAELFGSDVLMPNALFDFDDILEAIRLTEAAIEDRAKSGREAGASRAMEIARDPTRRFLDEMPLVRMGLDMWKTDIVFPAILRRSLLTTVCSHAEGVLRLWCVGLQEEGQLAPLKRYATKERLRTSKKYMEYLHNVAGLRIKDYAEWVEFKKLNAYWDVRNCIAHNAGIIDRDLELSPIEEFVLLDDSQLLMPHDKIIHILPGACEDLAMTAHAFFEKLSSKFLQLIEAQRPSPDTPPGRR